MSARSAISAGAISMTSGRKAVEKALGDQVKTDLCRRACRKVRMPSASLRDLADRRQQDHLRHLVRLLAAGAEGREAIIRT